MYATIYHLCVAPPHVWGGRGPEGPLAIQEFNPRIDMLKQAFRIRTRMVKKVKMNFKNEHRKNLRCENCDRNEEETQEHVMLCPAWEEERGSLDLTMMKDQVEFMMKVMRRKTR